MDPNLLIVKYIFKTKNLENLDQSLRSFFEGGVSFPKFIALLFDIETIPNIIENPQNRNQKKHNNESSIKYLTQNSKIFSSSKFKLDNEDGQFNTLSLILTNICFKIDHAEILEKSNLITQSLDIRYYQISNLIKIDYLTTLLYILTDGLVHFGSASSINQIFKDNFEKANVPLVINNQSITMKSHQYQFFIQILIIFNIFEEKINQIKKNPKNKKSLENRIKFNILRDISEEEMIYDSLLKSINAIGADGGFHFINLKQMIENDFIPKFVMHFFHITKIDNVCFLDNSKSSKAQQLKNIDAVVEFLKLKEKKFNVLLLDFKNPEKIESSLFLFFSNFLNFFFIKNDQGEIDERIKRLLSSTNIIQKEEFINNKAPLFEKRIKIMHEKILKILFFLSTGTMHTEVKNMTISDELLCKLFEKVNVPMIINEKTFQITQNYGFSPLYCQYRFMFNELDSSKKSHHITEVLLNMIYKIKQIKVPRYDIMISSIKAKRNAIISNNNDEEEIYEINVSKKIDKKIKMQVTFKERYTDSINDKDVIDDDNTSESYWNPDDNNYSFDHGILFDQSRLKTNQIKNRKDWMNEMLKIQKHIKKSDKEEITTDDDENPYLSSFSSRISHTNIESTLYKIFTYDEHKNHWRFHSSVFEQFTKDKRIELGNSQTPLILFINSFEEDVISVNSNFINSLYPNLNLSKNEIFIYALCDKSLLSLNFKMDYSDKVKASIKPIFLLLHVPESKENNPKIKIIVYQIYSFLSLICDIKIMILNQNYYNEQIEFMKNIIKINQQYQKESNSSDNSNNDLFSESISSSDENNEEEEEVENNDDEEDFEFASKVICKDSKIIFLINDASISFNKKIEQIIHENTFFMNISSHINDESRIHYINIKDTKTYISFLVSLNKLIINNKCSIVDEVRNNFNAIKNSEICGIYIDLFIDDRMPELKKIIHQRYSMLISNRIFKGKSFVTLNKLRNEICQFFPSYDKKFIEESNSILRNLQETSKEDRDFFASELEISSKSHLSFIKKTLKTRFFWDEKKLNTFKVCHKNFLKQELFDIIQISCLNQYVDFIYRDNFDIVEKQIKKDNKKIINMFKDFDELNQIKKDVRENEAKESFQKGSNYSMKETENIREIKVAIEINQDVKSVIEQDF